MREAIQSLHMRDIGSIPSGSEFIIHHGTDQAYWGDIGEDDAESREEAHVYRSDDIPEIVRRYGALDATIEILKTAHAEPIPAAEPSEVELTPGKILFNSLKSNNTVADRWTKEQVLKEGMARMEAWHNASLSHILGGCIPEARSLGVFVFAIQSTFPNQGFITPVEVAQLNTLLTTVHQRIVDSCNKPKTDAEKKIHTGIQKTLGYL